ncbi:MAG: gfo/Idh/MocA family oxidoreductase, partial [Planctomycetaceae bacterium]|nr:gfo/Idh/MocA family oxidoreductase [Planctomycetaceae bacterium]
STLMAIMGREACYTGQEITSEQMFNSKQRLAPAKYEWTNVEVPAVAQPGQTKLS